MFWEHILIAFAVSIRLFFPQNGIQTKSYAPHKNAALSYFMATIEVLSSNIYPKIGGNLTKVRPLFTLSVLNLPADQGGGVEGAKIKDNEDFLIYSIQSVLINVADMIYLH